MRVLYIHQFFATRESAHPTRSYEFARRWAREGHDVTMVTGGSRLAEEHGEKLFAAFDVDGIRVRSVRNTYSNYMGYPRRMVSFALFCALGTVQGLLAGPADVVFATSTPLTVGMPGWILSRLRRAPFVFEVRDLWPEAAIQMGALASDGLLARFARSLERFLYRRADALVGLSPGMIEGMIAAGAARDRTHLVPNCSDLDLFRPGPPDPATLATYDVPDDAFVAGYAGAIGPSNDVGVVLDAAEELQRRGRDDIVFLLAGDGKSLPALRAEAAERGLTHVRFTGAVAKQDVPGLLRSCSMLMTLFADVPILATNSPNKFFDGLASGRPMLVNSDGWTRRLVEAEEAGVYVPAGDGAALARAVEELADDPVRVQRLGANARALAEREFDRDVQARRLSSVLREAAG